MPYSTVRDAARYASQIILLNQGTFLESALLDASAIPHLRVDSHGTVAGTALFIGRQISTSIIFAGLDLVGKDIQTHVRPHAFDPLLEYAAKRTMPSQTVRYTRGFESRLRPNGGGNIGAFETYAGWFNAVSTATDIPIYRLNPSLVEIDGMKPLDFSAFSALFSGRSVHSNDSTDSESKITQSVPALESRKTILKTVLTDAQNAIHDFTKTKSPNPQGSRVFTSPTPLSMIYFASTRTLLKALGSMEPGVAQNAADETVVFIDDLMSYIDSWPV